MLAGISECLALEMRIPWIYFGHLQCYKFVFGDRPIKWLLTKNKIKWNKKKMKQSFCVLIRLSISILKKWGVPLLRLSIFWSNNHQVWNKGKFVEYPPMYKTKVQTQFFCKATSNTWHKNAHVQYYFWLVQGHDGHYYQLNTPHWNNKLKF
jgi:hypothetical protein